MKRFYSVEEMAEATGYSAGTVRNWIGSGSLPAIQGAQRGAFRIPAGAYHKRLAELGLGQPLPVELLDLDPPRQVSADEFYASRIAPALAESGYDDAPSLLSAMESDPMLYRQYAEVAADYLLYLADRSRQPALAG